jgi:hypothetical protein
LIPVLVGTATIGIAPLYSDNSWRLAATPIAAAGVAVLIAIPGIVMLVFVRAQLLWSIALASLIVPCVVAPVAAVRSDDAQAGLAMLLVPYVGSLAALVLAAGQWMVDRLCRDTT